MPHAQSDPSTKGLQAAQDGLDEASLWTPYPALQGGCQCGQVRYSLEAGPALASLCHCHMCQRATGSPFAAMLKVSATRVTWHGTPAVFASSNIAERGFCSACGTPLFYRKTGSDSIELTSGSLAPEAHFTPKVQWGIEGRHAWLSALDLPGSATSETGVISHQPVL